MSDICDKLVPKVTLPAGVITTQAKEACEKERAALDAVATNIDKEAALAELNKIVSGLKPAAGTGGADPARPVPPPDAASGPNWQSAARTLLNKTITAQLLSTTSPDAAGYATALQFVADHLEDFGDDKYTSTCPSLADDEATACGNLKGGDLLATLQGLTNADAAAMSAAMLAAVNKLRAYADPTSSPLTKTAGTPPDAGTPIPPISVPAPVVTGGDTPLGFGVYPLSFALHNVQFIDGKGAELDGFRAPEFVGIGGGDNAAGNGVFAPLGYIGYRSESSAVGAITGRWSVGALGWYNRLTVNTKDTKLKTDAAFNEGFVGPFGKYSFEFTKNIGLSLLFSLGYLASHGNDQCLSTGYDMPREVGCVKADKLNYNGLGGVAMLSVEAGNNEYASFSVAVGVMFGMLPGLGSRTLDSSDHDLGGFTVQIPTLDVESSGARWFLMLGVSR
ncbi:MAG: hypothetical protein HY696_01590 [Deltaproteobacteria bacterium]|nr:hypothetical protein [Deltaproteobacteria bacterium]